MFFGNFKKQNKNFYLEELECSTFSVSLFCLWPLQLWTDSCHLLPLGFSRFRLPDYPVGPEGEAREPL